MSQQQWRPSVWLLSLTRMAPAGWQAGRSIRAGLSVGGPMLIGALAGNISVGMWISMACLLLTAGEKSTAYATRFKQIAVTTPVAVAAYFLGALAHAPTAVTVVVMGLIAFACGIGSGYSGKVSVATMGGMLTAAIAIGLYDVVAPSRAAALFVVGAALYAAMLGVETLIDHRRPERTALVDLLRALAALAHDQAEGAASLEKARDRVTQAIAAYDALVISRRGGSQGPTQEYSRAARIVRAADQLFARELAHDASRELSAQAAARLSELADAVADRRRPAPRPYAPGTLIRVALLESALWDEPPGLSALPAAQQFQLRLPGPELLATAGRLALCTALAYLAFLILPVQHGYWIPLTVALVMKPDLGSVFSRAVLRCAGTLAGAGIAVVASLVTQSTAQSIVIGILAACLPWGMARSYAMQAMVMTPLIMLLIDLAAPGSTLLELSRDRVVATLIGATIVLVAGYLIWPSSRHPQMAPVMEAALNAAADYARDVAHRAPDEQVTAARLSTYRALSGAHVSMQRTLSEPPPAGAEAWAWIPVVNSAQRVVDGITGASATLTSQDDSAAADELDALAGELAAWTGRDDKGARGGSTCDPAESADPAIRELADELANLKPMLVRG